MVLSFSSELFPNLTFIFMFSFIETKKKRKEAKATIMTFKIN